MKIKHSKNTDGTCYQGIIRTTYEDLFSAFGMADYGPFFHDIDDKVTCEWCLDIDGVICTIYDWKTGSGTPTKHYDWHIGGFSKEAVDKVHAAFAEKHKTYLEF